MSHLAMFYLFFRIGLLGFGGGLAMLPLIFQGVQDFGFMSRQEFSNLVALSQITPGPVAVNAATYVGFNYSGVFGAFIATLGVTLPSFILMFFVANLVMKYYETIVVSGSLTGVKPVVTALVLSAAVMVAETSLFNRPFFSIGFFTNILTSVNMIPVLIFIVSFLLMLKTKINPIFVIIAMGLIGAFTC